MVENKIKGIPASGGIYEGIVRVVLEIKNNPDFEDGEVLVTHLTEPPMIIMMNKAGAIITDIGGLLCHAAIISRELNKPCVIGTKFATQILKDGDEVEVDADNGTVKIIKTKEN